VVIYKVCCGKILHQSVLFCHECTKKQRSTTYFLFLISSL